MLSHKLTTVARHYFDDQINTPSVDGSLYSAYTDASTWDEPEPDEL